MCAKRPSPKHELPISPADCALLADAMMLVFEDMAFDFAAHGVDYDHADVACNDLRRGKTAFTLLQTQAISALVRQALARLDDPTFTCPDLEEMKPDLLPGLRAALPRLSQLSSLLADAGQPARHK